MGTLALIGLGSNLGDRKAILDGALAALAATPGVTLRAASPCHETTPVGGPPGQGPFLNAAAAVETGLDPLGLLRALHAIERQAGRIRAVRWGERTLDLDLLLHGDLILDTPELALPHPRMAVRRFVLAPAAQVAPDVVDPWTGRTIAQLLTNLDRRPSYLATFGPRPPWLFPALVARLQAAGLSAGTIPEPAVPAAPWDAELDQAARELRADRWSADLWGDRWIVTDFWFDALALAATDLLAEAVRPAFLERFHSARERVIRPTFVVVTRPSSRADAAARLARARPIGWDTPMLWPAAGGDEATLSEVLAACAASRGA